MKNRNRISYLLVILCLFLAQLVTHAQSYDRPVFSAVQTMDGIAVYRLENGVSTERVALLENIYLSRVSLTPNEDAWMVNSFRDFSTSFDGRYITFTASHASQNALFIYDISINSLNQVTIPLLKRPIWSPNSQRIWLSSVEYPFEDYVYDLSSDKLFEYSYNRDFWFSDSEKLGYIGLGHSSELPDALHDTIYLETYNLIDSQTLVDLGDEIGDVYSATICNPTFSMFTRRFYYAVGCSFLGDDYPAYIYSTDLYGDNRIELDFQVHFPGETYVLIKGMYPAINENAAYILVTSAGYVQGDDGIYEQRARSRIIKLYAPDTFQIIYEHIASGDYLSSSSMSPDGRFIAMVNENNAASGVYLGTLRVFDIVNNSIVKEINFAPDTVCNLNWLNDTQLTYYIVPEYSCSQSYDNQNWVQATLDLETNTTTQLSTEGSNNLTWVIRPTLIESPIPLTVTESDASTSVTESGATDTYTLALGTQPTVSELSRTSDGEKPLQRSSRCKG